MTSNKMYKILFLVLCALVMVAVYANLDEVELSPSQLATPLDGGLACEKHPTHLACMANLNLTKPNHFPIMTTSIVHCKMFFASAVHCCGEFCKPKPGPGKKGHCDHNTGACFCDPRGKPEHCAVLTIPPGQPGYEEYEKMVKEKCPSKCAKNTKNGCTSATAVNGGPQGTVCLCYCP